MKKALFLLIPAFFEIFGSLDAITVSCNETYKAQNGRSCYPCSPGFRKFSDCVMDNVTARCTKCGTGWYQPKCDNSTICLKCSPPCLSSQDTVKECSDTSNIECKCTSGRFWQPDKEKTDEGHCMQYSSCIAGEGVLEKGTPFKDTKCAQCQEGVTYSDKESFDTCKTCSQCNTTIVQKCSLTQDTVCDDQNSGVSRSPSTIEKPRSGLDGGIVALIVIVVMVLFIIVVIVAVVCYRRKSQCQDSINTYDIESSDLDELEQSNRGNDSNEPSKQNDEHYQEVCENADHVVSENGIAQDKGNDNLGPQQTQQNLVQNNDISDHRTTKVSENGVVTNYRHTVNDNNFRNPYESSENTDIISTDVIAVSARPDSSDAQIGNDDTLQIGMEQQCKDETDRKVVACPSANRGVDTTVSGGSVQTDTDLTDKSMSVPQFDNTKTEQQTCLTDDEVWMEVFYFLGRHLGWNEFKSFFRWLVVKTNKELSETKDAEIERVHSETGHACKESAYKLMELWKQSTSNASLHDVLNALIKLQLIQKCEKLTEMLQKKGVVFETEPATEKSLDEEISSQNSKQGEDTTRTVLPEYIQDDNPQMMELKGQMSTL